MHVRITDISVSRFHSNLTLCTDGTVALTDNFSKFGTLLQIRQPIEVKSNCPVYVQIGRTLLSIESAKRYSFCERLYSCCIKKKNAERQHENYIRYEEAA